MKSNEMNLNNTQLLHLRMDEDDILDYQKNKKRYGMMFSQTEAEARRISKSKSCYVCGKECSSFCNSHSVPKFCLRRIAVDGKVFMSGLQKEFPIMGEDRGVGNAGTFNIICRSCDSILFQEYENPDAYNKPPKGEILAQIAMKNALQMISNRIYEIGLYSVLAEKHPNSYGFMVQQQVISRLDLYEYKKAFERAQKASSGKHDDWYYLCYYQELDYVVPMACQGLITLISDFEDNIINNLYSLDPDYKMQEINVAIFPLKEKSIVMLFIDSRNKRYRSFYRQLNRLPLEDQLAAINYLVLSYTENVFLSKNIPESVFENRHFLDTCQKSFVTQSSNYDDRYLEVAVKEFSLSKRHLIPNLLNPEYAIS